MRWKLSPLPFYQCKNWSREESHPRFHSGTANHWKSSHYSPEPTCIISMWYLAGSQEMYVPFLILSQLATWPWANCPTSLGLCFLIYIMQELHWIFKVISMILLLCPPDKTIWYHDWHQACLLRQTYDKHTDINGRGQQSQSATSSYVSVQENQMRETEDQGGWSSHQFSHRISTLYFGFKDAHFLAYFYRNLRFILIALFTIVKTWKQHKCPLTHERIKKMW